MFDNTYTFNSENSHFSDAANKLRFVFERLFYEIVLNINIINPNISGSGGGGSSSSVSSGSGWRGGSGSGIISSGMCCMRCRREVRYGDSRITRVSILL